MDGDGEDRPEDVPTLLNAFERAASREVVFAERTKRMESPAFRFFYHLYRLIHFMLTGIEVRAGNFSVAPRSAVTRLMAAPDLWNHYAATVFRARLPRRLLPLSRGRRLAGVSKMNFVSLLIHGLSAMSVFSEQVSARLLTASAGFAAAAAGMIGLTIAFRLFTSWAIPGWATYTVWALLGLVMQCLTFAVLFAFLVAHRRNSPGFVPLRDSQYFVLSHTRVWSPSGNAPQLLRALQTAQEHR
ncbi:MAG: glycosyltransferase [Bryobacteraceae bacterium]